MNNDISNFFVFSLTPGEALANLTVALICGIFIAVLYRATYRGVSYSSTYVISLIMLALITALVIMVIGNNLARAFGLVGAMSIIRFRTAVKDTQDIMFIFFSLAIGLACGAGMYTIALIGTFFIGIVIYISSILNDSTPLNKEYLIQIIIQNAQLPEQEIHPIIENYCSKFKLVNIKKVGEEKLDLTEYSYYVVFKKRNKAAQLVENLNKISYISKVNLFFDES